LVGDPTVYTDTGEGDQPWRSVTAARTVMLAIGGGVDTVETSGMISVCRWTVVDW